MILKKCKAEFYNVVICAISCQVSSSLQQSGMTFSHEVGHNFGSDHDEDEPGCPSDYIMSRFVLCTVVT